MIKKTGGLVNDVPVNIISHFLDNSMSHRLHKIRRKKSKNSLAKNNDDHQQGKQPFEFFPCNMELSENEIHDAGFLRNSLGDIRNISSIMVEPN